MSTSYRVDDGYSFPDSYCTEDKLHRLIRFAILSPSSRNTQPWRFKIDLQGVDIFADVEHSLNIADKDGRELAISVGAVAHRLRLAMRCHKMGANIEYINDLNDPLLMARVHYTGSCLPIPEEFVMMSQIEQRRDIAREDDYERIEAQYMHDLAAAAALKDCEILWVGHGSLRLKLAEMIEAADRQQFSDKRYRAELSGWMRSPDALERDGVPGRVVGLSKLQSWFAPWIVRHVNIGKSAGHEDLVKIETAPVLGVLVTANDKMKDWMDAGQALSAVLLRACYDDLRASCSTSRLRSQAFATRSERRCPPTRSRRRS